jgi:hypothetical protein
MTEFFKDALSQVPIFCSKFAQALAQPRGFGLNISRATSKESKGQKLNEALLFLGICLLVTAVCKTAVFGDAGGTAAYVAKDSIWKASLVMATAGVMRLSWRFVGGTAPYEQYVIANCYYFGILSVLVHIVLVVGKRSLGSITDLPPSVFLAFYACTVGPLMLWALYCWRVYGDLNNASPRTTAAALVIFGAGAAPLFLFSYGLRFALVGHVFRDWL